MNAYAGHGGGHSILICVCVPASMVIIIVLERQDLGI